MFHRKLNKLKNYNFCIGDDGKCDSEDDTILWSDDSIRYKNNIKIFFTRFLKYNPYNTSLPTWKRKAYIVVYLTKSTLSGYQEVTGYTKSEYYDILKAIKRNIEPSSKSLILYITVPIFVISTSILLFSIIKKNKYNNYNYII